MHRHLKILKNTYKAGVILIGEPFYCVRGCKGVKNG